MNVEIKELSQPYLQFRCQNSQGFFVDILNLGGIIQRIVLPSGEDMVLGYENPTDYLNYPYYMGAMIGPYANRISNASFVLNKKKYELEKNNGNHNLHSGSTGIHQKILDYEVNSDSLVLKTVIYQGEGGFVGGLELRIIYRVGEDNSLSITYQGTADVESPINLTNHSYFNLNTDKSTCLNHEVQIFAESFTENDPENIPTGEFCSVENTALDFRESKTIGRDIHSDYLQNPMGYDHNYIINKEKTSKTVAIIQGDTVKMRVDSNFPCMQFYTANFLKSHLGKNETMYGKHSGFCLETGGYPNAINQARFPSCVLLSNEEWEYNTTFCFEKK